MDCVKGTKETGYDLLAEQCIECEFKEECKESKISKKEMSEEKIIQIKNDIRENISIPEGELSNYRGCMSVINKIMDEYKESGLRKRKDYKDRKEEIKSEVKAIGRFPASDEKLNLLIDCAEYVFLGVK